MPLLQIELEDISVIEISDEMLEYANHEVSKAGSVPGFGEWTCG